MNALASSKGGVWHIHAGNQFATRSGGLARRARRRARRQVVMHQYLLGGGFGRRLDGDMVVAAVLAAKAVGKPVKLIYSARRRHGRRLHPAAHLPEGQGRRSTPTASSSAWSTTWSAPGRRRAGGSRTSSTTRSTRRASSTPSPSTARPLVLACPTTRCGRSSTSWRRRRRRRASCARWRRVGPSGRSKASWTSSPHAAGKDPVDFRLALLDGAGDNARGAQRARQCAAHRGRPCRLALSHAAEEHAASASPASPPGAGDRDLDRLRRRCRASTRPTAR